MLKDRPVLKDRSITVATGPASPGKIVVCVQGVPLMFYRAPMLCWCRFWLAYLLPPLYLSSTVPGLSQAIQYIIWLQYGAGICLIHFKL